MKVRFRGRDGGLVVVLCNRTSLQRLLNEHTDLEILSDLWVRDAECRIRDALKGEN